ncbi:MAG: hypothetical protein GF311_18800 [Candidatus Lokiarchaeota archaeon]|nr:hypothetical protein [Candidatus Lokiarchaeota archaeon]
MNLTLQEIENANLIARKTCKISELFQKYPPNIRDNNKKILFNYAIPKEYKSDRTLSFSRNLE